MQRTCSHITKLRARSPPSGGATKTCMELPSSVRVIGQMTTRRNGLALKPSADTTRAGRLPPCSWPRTGSRSTHHTSPRRGSSLGRRKPFLLPVLIGQAVEQRAVPQSDFLAVRAQLRWRHQLELAVHLFPELITRVPLDRVANDVAHGFPHLFRQGLERRVAPPREPDQRSRVRGHGLPNGIPRQCSATVSGSAEPRSRRSRRPPSCRRCRRRHL